ncbi:MAG: family 16 glycosylhydrolase [Prevotellaceae bacterium]|jgi:hypothetical protein|nr:family 16 glycosylhydrolase [Prevotellaceae bacterium]
MKMTIGFFLSAFLCLVACGGNNGATPPDAPVEFSFSPAQLTMPPGDNSARITVTANAEWSVSSDKTWCDYLPYMGYPGETTVKITTAINYTGHPRVATLAFHAGATTQPYTVTQEGEETGVETPDGYVLVWRDEFDAPRSPNGARALPDADKWSYETGDHGWGNNELQNYIPAVAGADTCAALHDGVLKITLRKRGNQTLSVRMNTRHSWLYGYFEARLKLPGGRGTWPAFWMLPENFNTWPDDGEIDIMEEVGYDPDIILSTIHCKAYNHGANTQKSGSRHVPGAEANFHVYAVEWTPDVIRGLVDGECYFEFPNDKRGSKDTWPFNAPFYLKLNLAWGGNWGGAQGVDESALPAVYEIDYVRVFQKQTD